MALYPIQHECCVQQQRRSRRGGRAYLGRSVANASGTGRGDLGVGDALLPRPDTGTEAPPDFAMRSCGAEGRARGAGAHRSHVTSLRRLGRGETARQAPRCRAYRKAKKEGNKYCGSAGPASARTRAFLPVATEGTAWTPGPAQTRGPRAEAVSTSNWDAGEEEGGRHAPPPCPSSAPLHPPTPPAPAPTPGGRSRICGRARQTANQQVVKQAGGGRGDGGAHSPRHTQGAGDGPPKRPIGVSNPAAPHPHSPPPQPRRRHVLVICGLHGAHRSQKGDARGAVGVRGPRPAGSPHHRHRAVAAVVIGGVALGTPPILLRHGSGDPVDGHGGAEGGGAGQGGGPCAQTNCPEKFLGGLLFCNHETVAPSSLRASPPQHATVLQSFEAGLSHFPGKPLSAMSENGGNMISVWKQAGRSRAQICELQVLAPPCRSLARTPSFPLTPSFACRTAGRLPPPRPSLPPFPL